MISRPGHASFDSVQCTDHSKYRKNLCICILRIILIYPVPRNSICLRSNQVISISPVQHCTYGESHFLGIWNKAFSTDKSARFSCQLHGQPAQTIRAHVCTRVPSTYAKVILYFCTGEHIDVQAFSCLEEEGMSSSFQCTGHCFLVTNWFKSLGLTSVPFSRSGNRN